MTLSVLALISQQRHVQIDTLLSGLAEEVDLTTLKISDLEMSNLSKVLQNIDLQRFDRTLLLLKNRYIRRQSTTLRSLPGLVIRETDACQDRIPSAKTFGFFTTFYNKLPAFRLICSGYSLSQYFGQKGIDSHFVPKGADTISLKDLGLKRDIEIGFIGKLIQGVYSERTRMIRSLHQKEGLQMFRTQGVEAYRNGLNRIRIFVSADIGLGEYMYKNFEAIACGCLLMAYRQGRGEEEALGFIDMDNVVLYSDENELREKLSWLRSHPEEVERIRTQGTRLVRSRWGFPQIGKQIAKILKTPVAANPAYVLPWWRRLFSS